jgi:hypothetical protein
MILDAQNLPGRLEPSKVYWGKSQCFSVETVADVSNSLDGTYFIMDAPASPFDSSKTATEYYVYYGTDPVIAGKIGIEVSYTTDDDADTIATLTKTAIDGLATKRFVVQRTANKLIIENREFGAVSNAPADGAVPTGFTLASLVVGIGGDLGATNGGITLNVESESVDITSDQTGSYILDQVNTGASVNMEMSLQEMDAERWALIVGGVVGDNYTPAGGTQITGFGEDKLYKNLLPLAGTLVLKPLSTADGDNSRNITFWRSAPIPSSINFDNEIQAMACTFSAYLDPSKPKAINIFAFGDQDQDGIYS